MKPNNNDTFAIELKFKGPDEDDIEVVNVIVGIEDRRKLILLSPPEERFVDNDTNVLILGLRSAYWPPEQS